MAPDGKQLNEQVIEQTRYLKTKDLLNQYHKTGKSRANSFRRPLDITVISGNNGCTNKQKTVP